MLSSDRHLVIFQPDISYLFSSKPSISTVHPNPSLLDCRRFPPLFGARFWRWANNSAGKSQLSLNTTHSQSADGNHRSVIFRSVDHHSSVVFRRDDSADHHLDDSIGPFRHDNSVGRSQCKLDSGHQSNIRLNISKLVSIESPKEGELNATNLAPNGGVNRQKSTEKRVRMNSKGFEDSQEKDKKCRILALTQICLRYAILAHNHQTTSRYRKTMKNMGPAQKNRSRIKDPLAHPDLVKSEIIQQHRSTPAHEPDRGYQESSVYKAQRLSCADLINHHHLVIFRCDEAADHHKEVVFRHDDSAGHHIKSIVGPFTREDSTGRSQRAKELSSQWNQAQYVCVNAQQTHA
ncbi:hypothetical protein F511_36138 [Dorcoceras hygrometricum]|uniref:Uncharacterized protein n=1 Tax=Dorcoceras hygrometricum TaxID=472368 RepID=A0A2Z7BMQ7_9LAMI|nr:hypothetical protein F511_36138 [Dorcoceras hygrometricum]